MPAHKRATKRRDGRYAASITTPDGVRHWFYGRTAREAQEAKIAYQAGLLTGSAVAPVRETLGHYLGVWLQNVARPALRESSYRQYRSFTEHRIIPELGGVRLQQVTRAQVQEWANGLTRAGLKPATVHGAYRVLHAALSYAGPRGRDLLVRNPADGVRLPRIAQQGQRALTPAQTRAFISAAREHPLGDLFLCSLTLGLRSGEARALKWEQVHLADGLLDVVATLTRSGGGWRATETKTRASRRTVPLLPLTAEALRRQSERQAFARRMAGASWQDQGYVFTGARGNPIPPATADRAFHVIAAVAGLEGHRPHDLRHSYGTALALAGVDLRTRMALLGHSGFAQTLHYTSVFEDDLLRARDRVARVFEG